MSWGELVHAVNGREVFGMRGVRDPDARCEHFDPMPNIDWLGMRQTAPGDGTCIPDGHYLCKGCRELLVEDEETDEEWEANRYAAMRETTRQEPS